MNPALPANERGKWSSLVLAAAVHAALGLFLFYGVRWQNRLPDPIEVELVSAPPPAALVAPPPPPAPPVAARPKPPAAVPEEEDEPEPEPPPRKQPDIAIKAPEPKKTPPKPVKEVVKPAEKPVVKPKPEPKPEPKPKAKPEPKPEPKVKTEKPAKPLEKPVKTDKTAKADADHSRALEDKRMRELMARDSESASQSHQIQEELARVAGAKASAARNKAIEAYVEKIRAKVKGNIVLPPGVSGDPFALFYVDQLPDGSVIEVRLKRSTGNAQLDGAIERAIQKSSPLPKPDKPELFNRTLELKFYPLRD